MPMTPDRSAILAMNSLWSVFCIVLPVLLVCLILIRKDHYKGDHPFWTKQNWSCFDVLLILIVIALLQLGSLSLVIFSIVSPYSIAIYGTFLSTVIVGLIQYKILLFKYNFTFSSIGLECEAVAPNMMKGLKIFILYVVIVGSISILLNHRELIFGRANMLMKLHIFQLPLIPFIFGLVVVAPFIEEFVYRGLMYGPFQRKLGITGSICATSFFWALNHLQIRSFVSIFLIGILLCSLYRKTQSLIPGMVVHSLMNLTNLIVYGYMIVSGRKI